MERVSLRVHNLPNGFSDEALRSTIGESYKVLKITRAFPSLQYRHEEVAIITIQGKRRDIERDVSRQFNSKYPHGSPTVDSSFIGLTPLNQIAAYRETDLDVVE